jgi:LCP family protein required for cell wall assembly
MSAYTPAPAGGPEPPPRPGRRMLGRAVIGLTLIILLIGGAVASAIVLEVKDDIDIFDKNSSSIPGLDTSVLDNVKSTGPQTILVLGSDHRFADGKNGRAHSDTMLLVRIDPSKAATTVMSVPRDLQIKLPGHGIVKLNASYFYGGPKLTVKTLKNILGTKAHPFAINHVVNINFGGFQKLLNRLGCVYVDVDRHYFNDNNPPAGGGSDYATINVKAGYQKLCGNSGLDYVRYRHFDDDLVRASRQQDFLRQAKDQIGPEKLVNDRKTLLKLFARNTQTDIRGEDEILGMLKLLVDSAGHPVQEVKFPGIAGPSFVTVEKGPLHAAVTAFMNAKATPGAKGNPKATKKGKAKAKHDKKKEKAQPSSVPPGLILNSSEGEDQAIPLATTLSGKLPVFYADYMPVGGSYTTSDNRAYNIRDRKNRKFVAYRIVGSTGLSGQYYGIQGMTWRTPPLLDTPDGTKTMKGRKYNLYYDGTRLRIVSWTTPHGVYWVANSLLRTLTNKQMLGIAGSVHEIG